MKIYEVEIEILETHTIHPENEAQARLPGESSFPATG